MNGNTAYGRWLTDWLEVYKKPTVRPQTLKTFDVLIRLHVPDRIKDTPLNGLTAFELQKALNQVPTSRTRVFVHDLYADSLRRAVSLDLITKSPMENVDKPKHRRKQGTPLSRKEIAALLCKLNGSRLKPLVLFYLYTGARRSEALSLKWSAVNFEANTVTLYGTKTDASRRTVPLMPELRQVLAALPRENDFVFNYTAEHVSRRLHRLCPAHKLHDLRHTFATRCLECGISIRVVQQWLGHTRLDTTASIYTHVLDNFNRIEANKFNLI